MTLSLFVDTKMLPTLLYKTLCSMLEVIAKFDDVGHCLYMLVMFYQLVLQFVSVILLVQSIPCSLTNLVILWGVWSTLTCVKVMQICASHLSIHPMRATLCTMNLSCEENISRSGSCPSHDIILSGIVGLRLFLANSLVHKNLCRNIQF